MTFEITISITVLAVQLSQQYSEWKRCRQQNMLRRSGNFFSIFFLCHKLTEILFLGNLTMEFKYQILYKFKKFKVTYNTKVFCCKAEFAIHVGC